MESVLKPSVYLYLIFLFFLIYLVREKYFRGFFFLAIQKIKKNILFVLFFLIITLFTIFALDSSLTSFVKTHRSEFAGGIAGIGNVLGKGDTFIFAFPVTAFVIAMLFKKEYYQKVFALSTASAFWAAIFVQVIKIIFARARPCTEVSHLSFFNWKRIFAGNTLVNADFLSMASGDVITAMSLCVPLFYFSKHRLSRCIFLLLPVVVCFGRIYNLAHWASDVFVALGIGAFIGIVFCEKHEKDL
jgi:membrane-associated phospholipid phosphatase